MLLLSSDHSFDFEILRLLSHAPYSGSDIAEVFRAASKIEPGNFESFYSVFYALAERVEAQAQAIDAAKHPVSARDAFFRAATYYRVTDFYLHGNPEDPRINESWDRATASFNNATALLPIPAERLTVHAEGFDIPCIYFRASSDPKPRPTFIVHSGFDGSADEMLHMFGFGALQRGYNALIFEGPGRLGLTGCSLGGYLAVRAAAFEHRVAAVVADGGVYDNYAIFKRMFVHATGLGPDAHDPAVVEAVDRALVEGTLPTAARWAYEHGLWCFNIATGAELLETLKAFTLLGVEQLPEIVRDVLGDRCNFESLGEDDAAENHCHLGARILANQRICDWFEKVTGAQVCPLFYSINHGHILGLALMSAPDWSRKVFRLRRLPDHVSTPAAVASLLSGVLALPDGHVVVHSVARAAEIFEVPSRTATLQMKSVPVCLQGDLADNEWSLPLTGGDTADVLVLDIHFEGITVLHDPAPGKHRADCIAISGLASHPFGSWQPHGKDKTFMWIRDALPASLPGVRTVVYGYGSKLPDSKSFQSIGDIARTLILHLKIGGWNLPSSKPVVFLAHSLGGIVLKEAIVQMADRDESITGILANVRGAVMFGVPSLGMEQSHLIAMVEGQANQSLVEDLSRYGGNYVRQLHTRFEGLSFLRKARLLWAYETEESPTVVQRPDGSWDRSGPRAVLVNPASATSNYYWKNKSITIPIHKDHSGMVKFTRGDAHLGIIKASIAEICSTTHLNDRTGSAGLDAASFLGGTSRGHPGRRVANQERKDEDFIDTAAMEEIVRISSAVEEMHSSLFSQELDFRVSNIEDPFQNTFRWVFDLPVFSKWLQEGSGLFWIHGKPGSGKSTLMKLIFQSPQTWQLLHNWQGDSLEIAAGFFFHYRGSTIQKSFEGVLRSLVVQILAPLRVPFRKKLEPRLKDFESARQSLSALRKKLTRLQNDLSDITKNLTEITDQWSDITSRLSLVTTRLSHVAMDVSQVEKDLSDNAKARAKLGKQILASQPDESVSDAQIGKGPAKKAHNARKRELEAQRRRFENLEAELEALMEALQDQQNDLKGQQMDLQKHKIQLKDQERDQRNKIQDFLVDEINPIKSTLAKMVNDFNQYVAAPETRFLKHVATVFQSGDDRVIPKLERVLRHVLDQNTIKMDLVLFFDALDEFDGHPDMISRFMKSLLTNSTSSGTRVKVCLSSRPWESFKVQFSAYPSFALQDHTKHDVEAYVVGKLTAPSVSNRAILKLATDIIERANGVFLWVKLALSLLLETATKASGPGLADVLEQKLGELPSDLFEFYELIVERISKQNRRRTFALLELLIRNDLPWAEAYTMRDAVLLSECTTADDAIQTLVGIKISIPDGEAGEYDNARSDIYTWSGGLVEIRLQDGRPRLQLMHQTVLEFVMGLWFKKMVVGDSAAILQENGHTFHLKYLIAARVLKIRESSRKTSAMQDPEERAEERKEAQRLAHHAEQSELTTGKSHLGFLLSAPHDRLPLFGGYITGQPWSQEYNFVSFAASFGLTLCLRDWIESGKELRTKFFDLETPILPLLSSLIFYPVGGVFHGRYLIAARLLLENGFRIAKDPDFFPMVLKKLWVARSTNESPDLLQAAAIGTIGNDPGAPESGAPLSSPPRMRATPNIPASALSLLTNLALDHGQDPNVIMSVFTSAYNLHECRPLHIATPSLARELIRHGADPTLRDSKGRPPISWILEHPFELHQNGRLDCAQRYEMCRILVQAGGVVEDLHISHKALGDSIAEFERGGYDASVLRELSLRVADDVRAQVASLTSGLDGVDIGVVMGLKDLVSNADTAKGKQKTEEKERKKRWRGKRWHERIRFWGKRRG
ncbi:hypothetical protein DL767_006644 [Monosporascus sp. MG133]|nr:hypothetical protein DL767_006644 [Monosporascus sp. MG133]